MNVFLLHTTSVQGYQRLIEVLGHFHPALVHFPIVLFGMVFVLDALNPFLKDKYEKLTLGILLAGAVFALFAVLTGFNAAAGFNPNKVFYHQWAGIFTAVFATIYSILRLFAGWQEWQSSRFLYIILSALLFVCVSITADFGGSLTHGTTPFRVMFSGF